MITLQEVVKEVRGVSEAEITRWIAASWVTPSEREGEYLFSAAEVARIRLIRDMVKDMMIEEETLSLVLSLLDQVYDLRHRLRCVAAALREQPHDVQISIRQSVRALMEEE